METDRPVGLVDAISAELDRTITPQFYHTLPVGLDDHRPNYHPTLSTAELRDLCRRVYACLAYAISFPAKSASFHILETAYLEARSRRCRDGPSPPRQ